MNKRALITACVNSFWKPFLEFKWLVWSTQFLSSHKTLAESVNLSDNATLLGLTPHLISGDGQNRPKNVHNSEFVCLCSYRKNSESKHPIKSAALGSTISYERMAPAHLSKHSCRHEKKKNKKWKNILCSRMDPN